MRERKTAGGPSPGGSATRTRLGGRPRLHLRLHLEQLRALFLKEIGRRDGAAPLGGAPPSHPAAPKAMIPKSAIPIDWQRGMTEIPPWPERDGRSSRIKISTTRSIPCTPSQSKPGFQNRLTRSCRSGNRCSWSQKRKLESESSCEKVAAGWSSGSSRSLLEQNLRQAHHVARMSWSRSNW